MTALARDRNTPLQDAGIVAVPMAAGVKIFAGSLVVANATGFAAPGLTDAAVTYIGRAEESADNTTGADGAQVVPVRRKVAFKWASDGTVTQAHLMKPAYIVDDQTVSADESGRSLAGVIVSIDSDGVWVE